jgi:hypothetical protein
LDNGVPYRIWIMAVNTAGNSPAYAAETGIPSQASSAPALAPVNLLVSPGDQKLLLTWDAVSGIAHYKVYYNSAEDSIATADEFSDLVPASAPRVSAELPLANGTPYYVWVQSWNSQSSNRTTALSGSVKETPKPKDPINFTNSKFVLGTASGEYVNAQDLPPSVFWPVTAENPKGGATWDRLTRVQESALGNLFADGSAWYIRKKYPGENIDLVFLNGGLLDNALPGGTITVGGVAAVGGGDQFMLLTLTGAQLTALFDQVAAKTPHTGRGSSNTGFFGMVSGEVKYTLQYYTPPEGIDPPWKDFSEEDKKTATDPYYYGRIKPGTLAVKNKDTGFFEAVDPLREYRICTTDYLASGAWFDTLLAGIGTTQNRLSISTPVWHGVAEYIYNKETVAPYTDGRVKIEGGVPLPDPWIPGNYPKP